MAGRENHSPEDTVRLLQHGDELLESKSLGFGDIGDL